MKATGIVRRIDDLGRVVIPKEIRRTMRIREGDPLEIYTDAGGEVIFKKYSPVGEMASFASLYAEALSGSTKLGVLICDRDHCIAVAGMPKKEAMDRRVTPELENIMESRRAFSDHTKGYKAVADCDRTLFVAVPIISSGDISGAVALVQNGELKRAGEVEIELALVAADFLGRQME